MILAIVIAKGFVCTDGLISGSLVLHWLWLCSVHTNFLLTPLASYDKGPSHFVWIFVVGTSKEVFISFYIKKNTVHVMLLTLHPTKK